jgi:hypothetical protein
MTSGAQLRFRVTPPVGLLCHDRDVHINVHIHRKASRYEVRGPCNPTKHGLTVTVHPNEAARGGAESWLPSIHVTTPSLSKLSRSGRRLRLSMLPSLCPQAPAMPFSCLPYCSASLACPIWRPSCLRRPSEDRMVWQSRSDRPAAVHGHCRTAVPRRRRLGPDTYLAATACEQAHPVPSSPSLAPFLSPRFGQGLATVTYP